MPLVQPAHDMEVHPAIDRLLRVDLDWLTGANGDWISRHNCPEAEIVGPLLAAEAEITDGFSGSLACR